MNLVIGSVFGTIWGIYSCLITFRAWKKKVVYLRLGIQTFRFNANNKKLFPVWWTTRFIATMASFFATGAVLVSWLLAFVVGLLIWPPFWNFIGMYWQFIIGYLLYYLIDMIGLRLLLFGKFMSDENNENSLKQEEKIHYLFKIFVVLTDFLFIPLGIFTGVVNVFLYNLIAVFKFMRPDVNIYPRGLESADYGHLTYVASVRITVEREVHMRVEDKHDTN